MTDSYQVPFDKEAVRAAALEQLVTSRADLEDLVRIPSVSAASFDQSIVQQSAEAVADLLRGAGMPEVEILTAPRPNGSQGAPAVVAHRPAPHGAPTVLLYAHHDVQPPGDESAWDTKPFEPTERNGRLYGRGSSDDKAGFIVHLNAIRSLLPQWDENQGIGITVYIEGEEEVGSPSFENFVKTYQDKLKADVIIVADAENWRVDVPSLTTSLRGMVDLEVKVTTLGWAQHSGIYGGAVPDAIMALTILLSRMWDDAGALTINGLHRSEAPDLEYTEEDLRRDTGLRDGVSLIGDGSILSRRWTYPSITVVGMDVPTIEKASNTLYASARAKLSLRVAPGQDATSAVNAVKEHLLASAPFGAEVEVTVGELGPAWAGSTDSPVYEVAKWALKEGWDNGNDAVYQGMGGSIPLVNTLEEVFPDAVCLVTGIEDPDTRAHGANESLDLQVFRGAAVSEALLLARFASEGVQK